MARRPELVSRSVSVLICSSSDFAKKRLAAVLIIVSESPTEPSTDLRTDVRNRAAIPPAIHVFHTEAVARANANAGGAILRTQCSQHLYDLAVDFCRDEALAVRVEAGGRPHLVLDAALERECGCRREP